MLVVVAVVEVVVVVVRVDVDVVVVGSTNEKVAVVDGIRIVPLRIAV